VIVEGRADARTYLEISEEGVAFPQRRGPLGAGCIRERGRDPCAHAAQEGAGVRHRSGWRELGALRLRQQQLLASTRSWRPRCRVRQQNLKGIVWHGEKKVEVARSDDFKAVVRDLVERTKDDPGVAAYQRGGTLNMVR